MTSSSIKEYFDTYYKKSNCNCCYDLIHVEKFFENYLDWCFYKDQFISVIEDVDENYNFIFIPDEMDNFMDTFNIYIQRDDNGERIFTPLRVKKIFDKDGLKNEVRRESTN